MLVTGTGLSHLGSAEGRDKMHKDLAEASTLTDSMRMFKLGLEGGKPGAGQEGVQPEWFYKGDGSVVAAPGKPLESPSFALDGGEEPEIVGLYLIGPDGTPWRIGFALGNEFSDHVTEKQNYLYLAHSKLRMCSLGPELLLGPAARRHPRHLAHPPRTERWCGRSRSCRARPTCPTRSRTSSATTSSIRCSAARATSTPISSAPRR